MWPLGKALKVVAEDWRESTTRWSAGPRPNCTAAAASASFAAASISKPLLVSPLRDSFTGAASGGVRGGGTAPACARRHRVDQIECSFDPWSIQWRLQGRPYRSRRCCRRSRTPLLGRPVAASVEGRPLLPAHGRETHTGSISSELQRFEYQCWRSCRGTRSCA